MMRLLIIEDSVALATNLKEIFDLEGYSTSVALNGHSGLELARKGFDVALVDIRLPDMLGTSLVPQLRALSTDAEVIIATANADLESAMAAVAAGAFAYLTKPVRSEELLLTVARAQNNIKLKRALATSERRLRTLVENVQALIVIANRQGILRFVSEASIDVIGADPSSLIGRNLVEWAVSHEEQDEWRAVLLETTQSAVVHEVSCLHADGSHRHLSWRWTRGTGDESDVLYGVGTDVTYRRELERRALMAEKLALAGQLTAGLAHEIRNPLNAAGLQLQVVSRLTEQGAAADDLRAPLEVVRHELQRLEELLHDFLDFARPRHYDRLPVDARVIVQRSLICRRPAPPPPVFR